MAERLAVEYRLVRDLKPDPRNARTHSRKQVRQIADSIKEFGWTNPILVDGSKGVIAGHGRLQAASLLGMTEVPVIELVGLTKDEKRAYMIADNQIALDAGWDADILAAELDALDLVDFDLGLVGFADLDAMMKAPQGPLPDAIVDPDLQTSDRPKGATSLQFNLIFDSEEHRKAWFAFQRKLKGEYPKAETVGQRLTEFLTSGGHGAR